MQFEEVSFEGFLNACVDFMLRIWEGRLFYCLGAEYANARCPYVLVRVTGTLSMRVSAEDLKVREGE